jgi:2-oxoisovalerate dehydrogenase E1 component alpha subunit
MSVTATRPTSVAAATSGRLSPELCLQIYDLMLRTRVLEDRLITMYKQGEGFFWIGGPGEEAFSVPLGLLIDKGQGVDHDYLHPHYRQTGTLLAMGADPVDSLRQMRNAATDPYSRGRSAPAPAPRASRSCRAATPARPRATSRPRWCGARGAARSCRS